MNHWLLSSHKIPRRPSLLLLLDLHLLFLLLFLDLHLLHLLLHLLLLHLLLRAICFILSSYRSTISATQTGSCGRMGNRKKKCVRKWEQARPGCEGAPP
ncbi:hypothetical protein QBC40DRAFT_280126 [Triangularia verruculosa]|uniref:Uncharacterized protein n=1 Tax=Triangularia verruculosa TaxID=2587418 RepID=A0AAN7AUZ9_9PEZI|nr:hypothetical protein QBC40DRAFT_280126 [Triangularia verruculosa]